MTSGPAGVPGRCPACDRAVPSGSRFCPACGAAQGATTTGSRLPWLVAGAVGVTLLTLLLTARKPAPSAPPPAPAAPAEAAPPDLSTMSPAERFDRLYRRIIAAAQSGDQATVTRFTPMALEAFGMLDTVTVDARYHLAMLQLHVGNIPGASAQADSIRRADPAHLFSYVIVAAVARWQQDTAARAGAYRKFLERYQSETAKRRPEYEEHRAMLEEVRKAAEAPRTS